MSPRSSSRTTQRNEFICTFKTMTRDAEDDEDDFPDEEILVVVRGAPRSSKADRKCLFDEAFAEDLRLKVVYFFLELEGLVEGVFTIYDQVNTRWWRPRSWRNWRWTLSKL
ncbi:uncharacterized protein KRP23_3359 [Phytophthora ramorum]|uniref:uncharacterized protein n=1 Tax=Phytophthora ramorum TaxID=164328 RepID=UPI00309EE710|nr:hypothetical protein KRP23_3359 [Phytophthora ramorum]